MQWQYICRYMGATKATEIVKKRTSLLRRVDWNNSYGELMNDLAGRFLTQCSVTSFMVGRCGANCTMRSEI